VCGPAIKIHGYDELSCGGQRCYLWITEIKSQSKNRASAGWWNSISAWINNSNLVLF
jgi:hypothetical protein